MLVMCHQKFNAECIKKHRKKEKFVFLPNAQPKLRGIDSYIEKDNRKQYQSKKNEIVDLYLFQNIELDFSYFNTDNYDITTLCYAMNCGLSLDDSVFAGVAKKCIIAIIDIWKTNENTHTANYILGVYPLAEVSELFQRELLKNQIHSAFVLDILFSDIIFSRFTKDTIEFYHNIFGVLLAEYFDSHSDAKKRAACVEIIRSLEEKIFAIQEEGVKVALYQSLTLTPTYYGGAGDWSKCPSGYSYQDKQFLNEFFSKYGGFHLKEFLNTINKLHLEKLLPEILLSVKDAFKNAQQIKSSRSKSFERIVREQNNIVIKMITKAFFDFGSEIKQDEGLTTAFEEILEMLTEINYEEAATILDEFRVH